MLVVTQWVLSCELYIFILLFEKFTIYIYEHDTYVKVIAVHIHLHNNKQTKSCYKGSHPALKPFNG